MDGESKLSRAGMVNLPALTRVKKEEERHVLTVVLSGLLGSSLLKSITVLMSPNQPTRELPQTSAGGYPSYSNPLSTEPSLHQSNFLILAHSLM